MEQRNETEQRQIVLQRLLRRRNRRGKTGANTGQSTTLHAWHSSYSWTPSSDHSRGTRWTLPLGIFLALASPALVAIVWNLADISARYGVDYSLSGLVAVVFWIGVIITCCAPIILVWMAVASALESHAADGKARLTAKSLHKQTMPPGDGPGILAITAAEDTADGDLS